MTGQSAVEHRPADVVSEPLIVQDQLADRIGQLLALPLALEPAAALGVALEGSCRSRLDRVSSSTEFVCGHVPDRRRLTGSVCRMPRGALEIPGGRIGVAAGRARMPPGDLAAHPLPDQRDGLPRPRIGRLYRFKEVKNMLCARRGPESE